jgi:hypothetical protein
MSHGREVVIKMEFFFTGAVDDNPAEPKAK